MNTFWVQVDVHLDELKSRFYMSDCGGHDKSVAAVDAGGWRAYESPVPEVIAKLCKGMKPVFVEVGASTGYYSLLAAVAGAEKVYASERLDSSREILLRNVAESALENKIQCFKMDFAPLEASITLHAAAKPAAPSPDAASSASLSGLPGVENLDGLWSQHADAFAQQQVLIKVDANAMAVAVVQGGMQLVQHCRPVILAKVLPGESEVFFDAFCKEHHYDHLWLRPGVALALEEGAFLSSFEHRDHLLIPHEKAGSL
jgi:FkbM family methyltransferase